MWAKVISCRVESIVDLTLVVQKQTLSDSFYLNWEYLHFRDHKFWISVQLTDIGDAIIYWPDFGGYLYLYGIWFEPISASSTSAFCLLAMEPMSNKYNWNHFIVIVWNLCENNGEQDKILTLHVFHQNISPPSREMIPQVQRNAI